MPDVSALFLRLLQDKGAIYIAQKLKHDDTARVKRWEREKTVPLSHRFAVMDLLTAEGLI